MITWPGPENIEGEDRPVIHGKEEQKGSFKRKRGEINRIYYVPAEMEQTR